MALTYIFYDARLKKLESSANFDFINKTLIKLAERAYFLYKRPISYYLSYLKIPEELKEEEPVIDSQFEK
jgi:hypothetical protein